MKALFLFVQPPKLRSVLRAGGAFWTALLFCAIASASGPGAAALPHAVRPRELLTSPWAIADLDGDHRPDLANSTEAGADIQGCLYRVEFQLSARLPNSSFTVTTSNHLGLNIVPRDVDGDSDLDLVITSGALHQPVGVWINDGQGTFTRADSSLYPIRERTKGISLLQPPSDQAYLFPTDEAQRPSFAIPQFSLKWRLDAFVAGIESRELDPRSFNHTGKQQSRAPPLSLHI